MNDLIEDAIVRAIEQKRFQDVAILANSADLLATAKLKTAQAKATKRQYND